MRSKLERDGAKTWNSRRALFHFRIDDDFHLVFGIRKGLERSRHPVKAHYAGDYGLNVDPALSDVSEGVAYSSGE